MTQDIFNIVHVLDGMKKPRGRNLQTPFERFAERVQKWALVVAGLLLALMATLALWHQFNPLPDWLKIFALVLGVVSMVLPTLGMIVLVLAGLLSLFSINRFEYRHFLAQIESDEGYAETLRHFDRGALERTKECLELKVNRTRNRLGLFAGSGEKLALLSIVSMGWATYASLSGTLGTLIRRGITGASVIEMLIVYAAAGLMGMTFGAVIVHLHMQRYVYQIELVTLALRNRS